jgi:hypothetical protein
MSRRTILAFGLMVVILVVPLVVRATTRPDSSGAADGQATSVLPSSVSTSSQRWADVPGLSLSVCATGVLSVTVSVVTPLNPAAIRVQADHATILQPASAPARGTYSFTFVGSVSPVNGSDVHTIDTQWKVVSPGSTSINRGNVDVIFKSGSNC